MPIGQSHPAGVDGEMSQDGRRQAPAALDHDREQDARQAGRQDQEQMPVKYAEQHRRDQNCPGAGFGSEETMENETAKEQFLANGWNQGHRQQNPGRVGALQPALSPLLELRRFASQLSLEMVNRFQPWHQAQSQQYGEPCLVSGYGPQLEEGVQAETGQPREQQRRPGHDQDLQGHRLSSGSIGRLPGSQPGRDRQDPQEYQANSHLCRSRLESFYLKQSGFALHATG